MFSNCAEALPISERPTALQGQSDQGNLCGEPNDPLCAGQSMNDASQFVRSGAPDTVERLDLAGLTLDLRREELRDPAGARIELRNRSFGVLRHLATNAGRVITKDELLTVNWPGVTVTEDSLTQCISEIRRALGGAGRDLIRTVPRRGYMIVLPDRPPTEAETFIATHPPKAAWYRHPRFAIAALFGAIALTLLGSWILTKSSLSVAVPVTVARGPTLAVLPFENNTRDPGQDMLADGLTQGMISALGRFSELRVLGRGMTGPHGARVLSAVELGRSLGVDYAVDGNLRRDGEVSRVDVRLSDARTGAQVWSKTFDAKLAGLATEDEISGKASAMIGSYWGAIGAAEYKRIQAKSDTELTSYECIVQGVIGTSTDITVAEPVAKARDCLERLTRNGPGNAAAWAALVLVFNTQRNWGFALPPDQAASVDKRFYLATKALAAANRAIELAPNDAFVRGLAARAAWMACQPDLVRIETRRAIALNPNDPQNLGPLGTLMAASGFWDEGAALAEKGIALTAPATPRWWWWAIAKRHWFRGEYQPALGAFQQAFVEQLWLSHLQMAYTLPFLERIDEAKAHAAALTKLSPGFTIREADAYYRMWCFPPSYRDKMREALGMAGLPQ
jgi:TolB-like protein/DNA-binding winged helix-turn-helix (wHTH) protein